MLTADRTELDSLRAGALSYGHSAGQVESKAEFINANVADQLIWKSISLSDQSVHISGDIPIVRHVMDAVTQRDGKAIAYSLNRWDGLARFLDDGRL